jgi:hypothetical protein
LFFSPHAVSCHLGPFCPSRAFLLTPRILTFLLLALLALLRLRGVP